MKPYLYTILFAFIANACALSRTMTEEDDIYYVPGKKSLAVQEGKNIDGKTAAFPQTEFHADEISRQTGSSTPPAAFTQSKQQAENVDKTFFDTRTEEWTAYNEEASESTGYWMGGFKGNNSDLTEIQRIINLYPEGFAFANTNGFDIAMNLSFDPDWNVYTDNGRYWWFPSNSNIRLYSSLLFGTYPKYIWTVIWDNPRFDSWSFNRHFNPGIRFGWNTPGWSIGFGWNTSWYDPWYNPWYDPWYNPWYGNRYPPHWHGHPGWNHPHWHYPHWNRPQGGHHPGSGNKPGIRPNRPGIPVRPDSPVRPSTGGSSIGVRPGSSVRPGTTGNRPNTGTRPGNNSTVRPGTTTTRPGSATRPGSVTRPGTTNRPTENVRPGSVTRPGTTARPGSTARPANTNRPNTNTPRPGSVTRPASTTRPGSTTRPAPDNSQIRPSTQNTDGNTTKTYSRPQNNYRPTYNTNSSFRQHSAGSLPANNRPTNVFPSRNPGGSQATPARNSSGSRRR